MYKLDTAGCAGQVTARILIAGTLTTLLCGGTLPAEAATPSPSVKSLQRQLEQRDAVIEDLQRRVQELERKTGAPVEPAAPEAQKGVSAATVVPPAAGPQTVAPAETPLPGEQEQAAEPAPSPAEGAPAAGQVTVTEEEAERALERTLVAVGVLLLPFGQVEVEPAFSYTRREDSPFAGEPNIESNEFQPSISARAGLPFDSQLELNLPYNVVQQDQIVNLGFGQTSQTDTGHSFGDLSIGVAKTIIREKGWRPDLIARFTWDTPTGQSEQNGVLLDGGFNEIIGELTALKRQDPLAFFASAFYQKTFEKDHLEPGDEVGFSVGAFLAASPETSLQISLDQTFSDDDKVNGAVVNDSGQVSAVLNLGVSSLLGPGVFALVNAGVGLTDESPDYSFTVSLPIRFDLPSF